MKKLVLIVCILSLGLFARAQWQPLSLGAAYSDYKVNDLYFINDSVGFAACWVDLGLGGIFKTVDGGLNWTATTYPGYWLQAVQFVSPDTGYAVGNGGRIYRTIDQGDTWQVFQTISTTFDFRSIHFVTHQKAFIGSSENGCSGCPILLITDDAWQTYYTATLQDSGVGNFGNQIVGINFYDEDTGLAVAETGNLFRTTDGGNTWLFNYELGESYTGFYWIFFNPQKTKTFLIGSGSVDGSNPGASIFTSYDVGSNWVEYPFGLFGVDTIGRATTGQFVSDSVGYIVGGPKPLFGIYDGGIMKTIDGGVTWVDDYVGGNNALYFLSLHCPTPNTCYCGGYNGVIMKLENADLDTSTNSTKSLTQTTSLNVFPNPVTNVCRVVYKGSSYETLQLYNYIGQSVFNQSISNTKSETLDMSHLPAGIYLIKVGEETKKVIKE